MHRVTTTIATVLLTLAVADAGRNGPAAVLGTARSVGGAPDGCSFDGSISGNGRFLVFDSDASDVVPGDTNDECDLFIRDLRKGTTVSVARSMNGGGVGDQGSYEGAISHNGRFVAFQSDATDLVPGDANGNGDLFLLDVRKNTTRLVSVASDGTQGNRSSHSSQACVSDNGRIVVFRSSADNLVPGDTNDETDVFAHDLRTGETVRVSVSSDGAEANDRSERPVVSGNGRFVAFASDASNLVPNDTNDERDVFVHDLKTRETRRVSIAADGSQGDDTSFSPSLDKKGRFCAFASVATNLTPDDTNSSIDVFLVDLRKGTIARVSRSLDDDDSKGGGTNPSISGKGRHVAFQSSSPDLVTGDENERPDIFVADVRKGTIVLASLDADGNPIADNSAARDSMISANGRFVAVESDEPIDASDVNNDCDVYVVDLKRAAKLQR